MAQDYNDIYTIVERLRILEEGLNKDQRSVNQLSATFKPKTVAVLTAKKDPKNPLAGKMVGSSESVDRDEPVLEADMAEDVLDKVKRSFTDFIKSVEDTIEDSDIKEKKKGDSDLKSKDKQDRDLVAKTPAVANEDSELGSALSGVIPAEQPAGEPGVSIKETAAVKTITNECGLWEMHGDEHNGFEIHRAGRRLPTRFNNLDDAEMAIKMFAHRRRKHNEAQDYIDEA
jgi:Mg2+ and Co2+ transporter CorA